MIPSLSITNFFIPKNINSNNSIVPTITITKEKNSSTPNINKQNIMIADDTFEINPEATIGMLIIINENGIMDKIRIVVKIISFLIIILSTSFILSTIQVITLKHTLFSVNLKIIKYCLRIQISGFVFECFVI